MKIDDRVIQLEQQIAAMEAQMDLAMEEIKQKDISLDELVKANSDIDNLLLNAEIGALYIDSELRIRKLTPIMTKTTNLRLADTGRSITEISLLDDYTNFQADVQSCVQTGNIVEREIQKGGTVLLLRMCPYYVRTGGTDGILVTLFDITKRLEAAKFELQVLINNIPGAVTTMRYDNGLIVEYGNDTMYELMHMGRKDFREQYDNHYEALIPKRDWEKLQCAIAESVRKQEQVALEYRVFGKESIYEWRAIQASILEERGNTPILQCVISDITDFQGY